MKSNQDDVYVTHTIDEETAQKCFLHRMNSVCQDYIENIRKRGVPSQYVSQIESLRLEACEQLHQFSLMTGADNE